MVVSSKRSTDLESETWSDRIDRSTFTENKFAHDVEQLGYRVLGLKHRGHFPDIWLPDIGLLFQVADARRSIDYHNVIKEIASYNGAMEEYELGIRKVIMIWLMPDDTWKGNFVELLEPIGFISPLARSHGSGTPAYKFDKYGLIDLKELLNV